MNPVRELKKIAAELEKISTTQTKCPVCEKGHLFWDEEIQGICCDDCAEQFYNKKLIDEIKKSCSIFNKATKKPMKSPKPLPADATKEEQREFWNKKIDVAKQHKEVAEETGNGGWSKMLDKRIEKYRKEIKNL